ncbi:MAG: peptidoglycan D,D-transpeptidase FtsI family protein, partial [Terriglobales bacterium]
MARSERQSPPRYRLASLQLGLLAWAVLVVARLYWLQVVDHAWLAQRARSQQQEEVVVAAQRGAIFDRNLTPLAMSLPVASLFADPRQIADPRAEAAALAPILGLDRTALRRTLAARRSFVWVARKVTSDQAEAAEALHLGGIYAQPATRRFYPKGELAAGVLGYVGVDGRGLGGIEHSFDAGLRGVDGQAVVEVDARRQSYSQIARQPVEGENLVLTLDQNIQYITQQALDRQVATTHARRGVAVVENPHTGEILALANSPTFNPDDFQKTPAARLGDRAISDPYEPGSIFKLITISAALQQGLVTPEEMIDCQNGAIKVGGRIIHDHQPFGLLSVSDVLKHSSDVG